MAKERTIKSIHENQIQPEHNMSNNDSFVSHQSGDPHLHLNH